MFLFNKIALYTLKPFLLKKVASDQFGNTYYIHRFKKTSLGKPKRICFYKGIVESSRVPPIYHAWLHYTSDEIPNQASLSNAHKKEHLPNLTGTSFANINKLNQVQSNTWYQQWHPSAKEKE